MILDPHNTKSINKTRWNKKMQRQSPMARRHDKVSQSFQIFQCNAAEVATHASVPNMPLSTKGDIIYFVHALLRKLHRIPLRTTPPPPSLPDMRLPTPLNTTNAKAACNRLFLRISLRNRSIKCCSGGIPLPQYPFDDDDNIIIHAAYIGRGNEMLACNPSNALAQTTLAMG